jgi:CRP-like cAMP-binding protein
MFTTDRIDDILKANEYFAGLKPAPRRALAEICLARELKKNEVLFNEGYAFFLLLEGAVRVSRSSQDGRETVIKVIKPGEVFGEVVLFEAKEYPARAVAIAPGAVLVVPKKQIDCLLEGESFRRAFLGLLMNKIRYLTDRLLALTSSDVEERFFLFLEEHFGGQTEISIGLSKKEIAAAIGANPETFSRLLARLEKEGRISWKGRMLKLISQ